ncbi:hypothetical protein [Streptomyces gibsoniae]|uniref:Uncharacterized protein n=1 Tax=Streptomyces gibsoniae TaxID=3075529 RepID=A0ABU2UA13_9ACTN|nr:hypothetical protein [Streptomyces sp. DSM 41699]MDT0470057.1 hypothetical protein [Streptomyces sp. DSM 41699]
MRAEAVPATPVTMVAVSTAPMSGFFNLMMELPLFGEEISENFLDFLALRDPQAIQKVFERSIGGKQ